MESVSYLFLLLLFAALYILRTIHYTHMFQLNSYKSGLQIKWLWKNKTDLAKTTGLLLLNIPLCFFVDGSFLHALVFWVSLGFTLALSLPTPAKKPLVYTKRVKRLLVTNGLLLAGELCLLLLLPVGLCWRLLILTLSLVLSPLTLLLCNLINRPLENGINRYYIKDAERIIANHTSLITIGVTGSYGKTSVKYMLGTLLEAKYNVLVPPASYNTTLGVTRVIRESLRATHDVFVCEMGAKGVGEIKEICDIVHPTHGIITSVGPQHLESFQTLDNVKKTKFELADALPTGGKLFLNGEDENIRSVTHPHPALSYGFSEDCDYYADCISVTSHGTSFRVNHGAESVKFEVSLIGVHNVLNLVGAIALCCELGIALDKLPSYARRIKPVAHRLQLSRHGKLAVIDDAYNSNPSGVRAAMDVLSLFTGKKIVVTPGMVELGTIEDAENRKFGHLMAEVCDYVILVGQRQTAAIRQGLLDGGFDESKIFVASNVKEASDKAFGLWPEEEKTVLFENDLPDNY